MSVRVLLVDDQPLLRTGFRMILEETAGVEVVGEAHDGVSALREAAQLSPDVILMDIRMPVMDGLEATRRLTASASSSRVLILTTFDLDEYAYAALRAGASGFVLKDSRRSRCGVDGNACRGGEAESLPDPPESFSDGWPAAIWV